jgi:copper homeostasis protein
MKIEIVAYNIESAMKAQQGGADRVEFCDNPGDGGTTPSYGSIELARQHLNIDFYVMIRPRGGDFIYSIEEYHAMRKDIDVCKKLSVDGVVLGALTADGSIDKGRCKKFIDQARPMKVTCHRAFDMTRDPFQALEDCIEAGFDRILTSGQQMQAIKGVDVIAELVKRAGDRIVIMPGSGINENTVSEIVRKTKANEIHFSATAFRESVMQYRNEAIGSMGSDPDSSFTMRTVDPERIRLIRRLAEDALKI